MPLEATMMAIDNSEYMRDGDFIPTRLEAVKDACNIVWSAKTQQHAESTVGLLTMGGRIQLHETLTNQPGRMIAAMAGLRVTGDLRFIDGINVAALGLKHRQNKQQRQRIVVFVGSPIPDSEKDLEQLGKKLKKNSVAIDVVAFGAAEQYEAKLQKLVDAPKSGENCHLLTVPAGLGNLADLVISSPIVAGEDGAPPPGMAMGGGLDFNPENDPELAMALRLSLEDERARQEAEQKAKGDVDGGAAPPTAAAPGDAAPMQVDEERELTEAEEMELALKMSLEGANVADGVDALIQDEDYMAELQQQLKKEEDKQ